MSGRESNLQLPGTFVLISDYIKFSFPLLIQQLCRLYKAMLLTSALKLSHGHSVISGKRLEMDGRWTLFSVNKSLRDMSTWVRESIRERCMVDRGRKTKNWLGIFVASFFNPSKNRPVSYLNLPTVLRRGETAHFIIFAYDLKPSVTVMGSLTALCTGK